MIFENSMSRRSRLFDELVKLGQTEFATFYMENIFMLEKNNYVFQDLIDVH